MTRRIDLEPKDGVWPGEAAWLKWEPPTAPSETLLDRIHAAVVQDLATIRTEAARVDDFAFPAGWLEAYEVPAPSDGFVSRTLAALQRSRSSATSAAARPAETPSGFQGGAESNVEGDVALDAALAGYGVPEPSPDFVDRTIAALATDADPELDALMGRDTVPAPSAEFVDRTLSAVLADRRNRERSQPLRPVPLHEVGPARPAGASGAAPGSAAATGDAARATTPSLRAQMRGAWASHTARWGAAAAVLLALGVLWTGGEAPAKRSDGPQTPVVRVDFAAHTPAPIAAAMARAASPDDATALVPDPLLLLASGALDPR